MTVAVGVHPVPSRTWQLSPPAPRILRPQGRGKVGRCPPSPAALSDSRNHGAQNSIGHAGRLLQLERLGPERRKAVNESGPEGSSYKRTLLGASGVPGRTQLTQPPSVPSLSLGTFFFLPHSTPYYPSLPSSIPNDQWPAAPSAKPTTTPFILPPCRFHPSSFRSAPTIHHRCDRSVKSVCS